jgi:murein DD-endopeptidase MepM/ murein hydrolase activator NlpD
MHLHRLGFALLLACGCDSREAAASATSTTTTASTTTTTPAPATSSSAVVSASSADALAASAAAPPAGAAASAAAVKADPSHLVLKGNAIQGGVVFAKIDAKIERIEFPGHRTVVSDEGDLPIAFFRNAPPSEKMVIHFKDGSVLEQVFKVEQRTFGTEKIDGLPEDEVRLDPKGKKANDAAEARIDAVRMKYGNKACYKDGFAWPVTGKITSHYGLMRVLNGTDGGIHWGVDIAVPTGTPIKAPACGTVVFISEGDPLSGSTLVLDHGHGLTSTFLHLSGFTKKVGDEVKRGDVLAKSGQTGRATGAHLDWRMNYFEIRIDPELLVPPMGGK